MTEVTRMLKKTAKGPETQKPENRLFRMFRPSGAFHSSSPASMQPAFVQEASEDAKKACAEAVLEAEYEKARALRFFRNSAVYC